MFKEKTLGHRRRKHKKIKKLLLIIPIFFLLWMLLNIVVDPFGVFGDEFFKWDDYNITQNPKIAKVEYISDNFDKIDSYIIGSSVAATFDVEKLNGYTDCSFYNMFHRDVDTAFDKNLVSFLIENDDVKNIFYVLSLRDANSIVSSDESHYKISDSSFLPFYFKKLFASYKYSSDKINRLKTNTFLPQYFDNINYKTGCLDTCVEDVEQSDEDNFTISSVSRPLTNIDACIKDVESIATACKQNNVNLTVLLAPSSESEISAYTKDSINEFYKKLSSVVDFWDFSLSAITYDIRYFYNTYDIRSDTTDIIVSRVFNDKTVYCPDNFGIYYKENNFPSVKLKEEYAIDNYTKNIPILMLHHFDEKGSGSAVLSYEKFEHVLSLLKENNYNTVTFKDLMDFVKSAKPLPENPVVLTFDDGYTSNYEYVYPTLKKFDYKATIFVIGDSVGCSKYKNTDVDIIPHFDKSALIEMVNSGYIDIYSHTYDMHRSAQIEQTDNVRANIRPLENEKVNDYITALNDDINKQNELFGECGLKAPNVLAFPGGKYRPISNTVLRMNGYDATITTNEEKTNTLVCGLTQSLINLGRLNVAEYTTDDRILEYLKK